MVGWLVGLDGGGREEKRKMILRSEEDESILQVIIRTLKIICPGFFGGRGTKFGRAVRKKSRENGCFYPFSYSERRKYRMYRKSLIFVDALPAIC